MEFVGELKDWHFHLDQPNPYVSGRAASTGDKIHSSKLLEHNREKGWVRTTTGSWKLVGDEVHTSH